MANHDSDQGASSKSTDKVADSPNLEEILKYAQSKVAMITELAETANVATTSSVKSKGTIATILADAQAKLAEITTLSTQAVAAQTKITDYQAVIATKSDHIQKAQEHADSVRAGLDRTLTAATQHATEAEGQKSRAQSAADNATKLLTDIRTAKGSVEAELEKVTSARKEAEESATLTKKLADKSNTVEANIIAYEKRLGELEKGCADRLKTIESLLPGATSAGLAHAFDDRRQTFLKPHNRWQYVFVGSVLAIVGLTVSGLLIAHNSIPTYDELVRLWLARLPVVCALAWLAIHASRESALAKRLEEDYGYKSAIASCFEGFRRQMSEIGKDVEVDSPLAKLCTDSLKTIANPPGRIYDNHKLIITPTDELKDVAKFVVDDSKTPKIRS